MNTYTDAQIATLLAAKIDLNEFFASAVSAPTQAQELPTTACEPCVAVGDADACPDAAPTKALTRSAWKALRMTKAGKVRKQFAGMTREQALEAGLLPGYHLPTGAMRVALAEANRTGAPVAECFEG